MYIFPGCSVVKNPPVVQKTWIQALGREEPLEKEMASHPNILNGKSHGQRSLVGSSPWSSKRLGHDLVTKQQCKPKNSK